MGLSWNDMRMFLGPEVNAGISLAEGEDPTKVAGSYATGQLMSSGLGELQGATESVENASDGLSLDKSFGLEDPLTQDPLGNASQDQLYSDAVNIPTTQQLPQQPTIESSGLQDSGVAGQANIKLDNNALNPTVPKQGIDITNSQPTGIQYDDSAYQSINTPVGESPYYGIDGYTDSGLPPPATPEEAPGTFLGLEGKDYTKMGMQGVLAAGVSAASPTPVQPSKAPAGPGMTKGNPMPQGGMQGVNSMIKPVQPLNSMQMTQAQGLISPFQRDRYRRGQY